MGACKNIIKAKVANARVLKAIMPFVMAYTVPKMNPSGMLSDTRKLKTAPIEALTTANAESFDIMPQAMTAASCKVTVNMYFFFINSPF